MQEIPGITITDLFVHDMSRDEYNQCKRLGYKDGLIRRDMMRNYQRPGSKSKVVLAKDPDGRVRSWALIDTSWGGHVVNYWTQRRWRRRGIGKRVADRVTQIIGNVYDHYADPSNFRFFESIGAQRHAQG